MGTNNPNTDRPDLVYMAKTAKTLDKNWNKLLEKERQTIQDAAFEAVFNEQPKIESFELPPSHD